MADVWTILALLLVPVFAEYAKVRGKASRAFNLVFGAGVLLLLANSFSLVSAAGASVVSGGTLLFNVIAWILLLVGSLWAAYNLVQGK